MFLKVFSWLIIQVPVNFWGLGRIFICTGGIFTAFCKHASKQAHWNPQRRPCFTDISKRSTAVLSRLNGAWPPPLELGWWPSNPPKSPLTLCVWFMDGMGLQFPVNVLPEIWWHRHCIPCKFGLCFLWDSWAGTGDLMTMSVWGHDCRSVSPQCWHTILWRCGLLSPGGVVKESIYVCGFPCSRNGGSEKQTQLWALEWPVLLGGITAHPALWTEQTPLHSSSGSFARRLGEGQISSWSSCGQQDLR